MNSIRDFFRGNQLCDGVIIFAWRTLRRLGFLWLTHYKLKGSPNLLNECHSENTGLFCIIYTHVLISPSAVIAENEQKKVFINIRLHNVTEW